MIHKKVAERIYMEIDDKKSLYLEMHVMDCMSATMTSPTMKKLLERIAAAKPSANLGKPYPDDCTVWIQTPLSNKLNATIRDPNIRNWAMQAKTAASACNDAAAKNGSGSGSWFYLSSREFRVAPLHITFAHELIHCLHAAEGNMNRENKLEEYATVGIHGNEGAEITENRIRHELGISLRNVYFGSDDPNYKAFVS